MARLPISRISGIAAWTAASVTWGTAVIAVATEAPSTDVEALDVSQGPPAIEAQVEILAPMPEPPERGILVLRYTPVDKPEARVVVKTVEVRPASPTSPGATAPAAPPRREKSSGS